MFNVGGPEILVIFLVALIVLGPQQLPKAMRTLGSVMAEVRKVSNSFQAEMRQAMDSVVDTSATEKPHSATMADADADDGHHVRRR
jgi:Tat protein translocase TatB subunit